MKDYKTEVWVTAVCFALVALLGGFLSLFFVLGQDFFFVETDADFRETGHHILYLAREYVMGFPIHYFLLIMFSWIGVAIIGLIWTLVMDRLEDKQRF